MKTKSELRQHKLFVEAHIVKAVLRVSLPAIVIAFMAGLYVFADQVMMVNLIPRFRSSASLYSNDLWNQFQEVIANNLDIHITNYDTATIIRTAVAYSAPIPLVINAAALLIGNGASINFNRYNGQGNLGKAESA
ncbi:hypothetical protein FACS1894166_01400 [Bacilli bacterium]|nr:hypothetical protein FACS1894166_01400 [Bacilli bacterium]